MTNETYREALAALALEIGVDAQALADQQALVVDGVTLGLAHVQTPGGEGIQVACKVGPLPPNATAETLRLLLQANTLGPVTAGATVGLQHGADDVVLARRHPLDTPPAALARACQAQSQVATLWAAALAQGQPEAA